MPKQPKPGTKFSHTAVNVLIIALIAAIYFCMLKPPAAATAASPSVIYKGRAEGSVALQFIVSWNAPALGSILDTLSAEGIRASFFVSGRWAEENPEMLKRIKDSGHELGTLGYSPAEDGDDNWLREDISRSLGIIKKETGYESTLYYCGERRRNTSHRAAQALGLRNVRCTYDLLCARGTSYDIIERVPVSLRGGEILLMTPTGQAAEALPGVIRAIERAHLSVCPTGRLLTP